jgi:hypothetical protein
MACPTSAAGLGHTLLRLLSNACHSRVWAAPTFSEGGNFGNICPASAPFGGLEGDVGGAPPSPDLDASIRNKCLNYGQAHVVGEIGVGQIALRSSSTQDGDHMGLRHWLRLPLDAVVIVSDFCPGGEDQFWPLGNPIKGCCSITLSARPSNQSPARIESDPLRSKRIRCFRSSWRIAVW